MRELVRQIAEGFDSHGFINKASGQSEISRSISKFKSVSVNEIDFYWGDEAYIAKAISRFWSKIIYADVFLWRSSWACYSGKQLSGAKKPDQSASNIRRLVFGWVSSVGHIKHELCWPTLLLSFRIIKGCLSLRNFGVGKSYMMAALAHDLSEKNAVINNSASHYRALFLQDIYKRSDQFAA